jgi:hypothetical protein
VGDQLDAQFDAARVQRAQDAVPPVEPSVDEEDNAAAATAATGTDAAGAANTSASSSSDSAATDYIAEADTNNDRKVSEQERIAYAKKQASEAEKGAAQPDAAQGSLAQEVQQAYLPQETSGSRLDTSA